MRVSVLGCGRWGTFHAWYANRIGHDAYALGARHCIPIILHSCAKHDRMSSLSLPESICLTDDS